MEQATNPKEKFGAQKPPMSNVPVPVLLELGLAMGEGAIKYGPYNFRDTKIKASTYYDATMRHLMSYWEGEHIDPDSGMSHLIKAMASLVVWRDATISGHICDDRPRPARDMDMKVYTARWEAMKEKINKSSGVRNEVEGEAIKKFREHQMNQELRRIGKKLMEATDESSRPRKL